MRLGVYLPVLDEKPAGVGVYLEEVCSRLVRKNPDVVVYTGTPEVQRPWLRGLEVKTIGPRLLPEFGVATGARRRARRLRWLAGPCAWELPRDGVDVLFSPVQEGPLVGRTPTVMVLHDLTALKHPDAYDRFTVAQTRWVLPRMLRHARTVVAVSQNTRADALDTFGLDPARVTVIGEGYDTTVFRPRPQAESREVAQRLGLPPRYLMYAGTFSKHKNLGVVLEAMAALPPEFCDLGLVLVGRRDAGAFAEFESQARALGLWSRVHLPGYVSRDDLARLMSGAEAFVYPSRYEGFGLAPLEAMACGARVVASDVASLPEVVGAGGTLVASAATGAWTRALVEALAVGRDAARERATRQAARFDWDAAVAGVAEVLQRTGAPTRT